MAFDRGSSKTGGAGNPAWLTSASGDQTVTTSPPPSTSQLSWRRSDLRVEGQNLRRQKIVARQKEARRRTLAAARAQSLISGNSEAINERKDTQNNGDEDDEDNITMRADLSKGMPGKNHKRQNAKQRRRQQEEEAYAAQLQRPEWMLEVPSDLGPEAWSVMAKPEGEWTLVVAAHGKTVSRRKNGRTLHEFASVLPHGSPQTGTGSSEFSMLQCVFHEADQTYYVVDIVFWKGLDVGASDFSFRQFWLHSKLAEIPEICTPGVGNKYRFQPIPVFDCSMDGLGQAYGAQMQFVKDGLLFFFKKGHYEEGLSPCLLAWKDAKTSRFPIDSPDGIHPYPVQTCVLRISLVSGTLMLRALGDDLVGILNVEDAKAHALENGSVARFAVPSGGLEVAQDEEGAAQTGTAAVPPQASARTAAGLDTLVVPAAPTIPEAAASVAHVWISGLRFHSACRPNARPDSSCRVAFQYAMRHDPLTIEKLKAGLARAGNDMEFR